MPPAGYRLLANTGRSQAATMVLEPGKSIAQNEVAGDACDQWVYVTRGEGRAYVGGCWLDIKAGSLLLIEAGESHEIRATGRIPLETISICATPVDDTTSDIFGTYWISAEEGQHAERLAQAKTALPDDIAVWDTQIYMDPPGLSPSEAAGFRKLRTWARTFYPEPATSQT